MIMMLINSQFGFCFNIYSSHGWLLDEVLLLKFTKIGPVLIRTVYFKTFISELEMIHWKLKKTFLCVGGRVTTLEMAYSVVGKYLNA